MAWVFLIVAGLLEATWAVGLKWTEGFTRPLPTAVTVICMLASFGFLAQALKEIPIGTGYAIWTGIGATGTAIVGMLLFGESRDPLRLLAIAVIVAGIGLLKWVSP